MSMCESIRSGAARRCLVPTLCTTGRYSQRAVEDLAALARQIAARPAFE
jgi:hypothetical protein